MSQWLKLYNCERDPFVIKPLTTFEEMNLFYKLPDISNSLDEIISKKNPGIYGITGPRGLGKTSTLFYIGNQFKKDGELIVSIRVVENIGSKTSPEIIGGTILKEILEGLTKQIYFNQGDIYDTYKELFEEVTKQLGMKIIEDKLLTLFKQKNDYELQRKFIIQIIEILKENKINSTILIDNLDKFLTNKNQMILKEFLSGGFAQSFFEEIVAKNCKILLTLSDEIYDYLSGKSSDSQSLNYLRSTINLNFLKDVDAMELLKTRFKSVSTNPLPFDPGSIQLINDKSNGIIRTLLWNSKYVLQIASDRNLEKINSGIVTRLLKTQDIYKIHENLRIESSEFRSSVKWLFEIIDSPNLSREQIIKSFIYYDKYQNKDVPISKDEIHVLRKLKIISEEGFDLINENFYYLLKIINERNLDFSDWLNWYIKTDLDFKNITAASDILIDKLKRLEFHINHNDCKTLTKFEHDRRKVYDITQVKAFINQDLSRIIDKYSKINLGMSEETSDYELIDIWKEIIYYFMRMANTILYSNEGETVDFNKYYSTSKLFSNAINNFLPYDTEIISIINIASRNTTNTSALIGINKIIEECKKEIILIINNLITLIQNDFRERAKRELNGKIPSIESITKLLRLSTGNWCNFWIEGISPIDFNVMIWEEKDLFYSISIGTESKFKKYFDIVNYIIQAAGIAKSINLGNVSLDSCILCSNKIYELIDYGIFINSKLIIPPTFFADIKYTNSGKTKEKLTLEKEKFLKKCDDNKIKIENNETIPSWISEEITKIHPSDRSATIDSYFIKWVQNQNYTALIGDRGNIADVDKHLQQFWMSPNKIIKLSNWSSMLEFFELIQKSVERNVINFRINEMSGNPLAIGNVNTENWDCNIEIMY